MTRLFITGTDTDSGKTIVTGYLYKEFLKQNQSCITHKWCQCGNLDQSDIDTHDLIANIKNENVLKNLRLPYQFKNPVSPHLANTDKEISRSKLTEAYETLSRDYDNILIEGAGGLMVPLSRSLTILDILSSEKIPTVLVVNNIVGCINHSLLSLKALKSEGVPVLGFIMNNTSTQTHPLAQKDNAQTISELSKTPCLGEIPYITEIGSEKSPELDLVLNTIVDSIINHKDFHELVHS